LLNRPPEEIQWLESGLAALPATDVVGRIPLAKQFDVDGDTGRALQEAQAIRNQNPTDGRAILAVVDLLIKSQRISEARPLVADLLAREPTNPHAHYEMGVILALPSLPEHDFAAAEHELLTAAREAPGNQEYYRRLGEFYFDLGKWRQCAYMALQLLAVSPDAAVGRQYLSQSLAHLGDKAGAAEQGAIAARLITRDSEADSIKDRLFTHASSPEANLELAQHCEKYGLFSNALVRIQQACVLAPSNRGARAALEDLCARIGTSPPTIPLPESKHL
jgi:predicted Zn-dependent protease